jgi:hypothetical protein
VVSLATATEIFTKTQISSVVVKHLQDHYQAKNAMVVFMYCNYKDQARQTIPELVASLLKQVLQVQPQTSENIKSFYKHHFFQGSRPNCSELREAFQSEIGTSTVFLVVDALDECLERDQEILILELKSLASDLHLMVTSRPLPLIEQLFQGAIHLEIRATDDDVQKYIRSRILRERRLKVHVAKDKELQNNVEDKVMANVRGMYGLLCFSLKIGC